MGGWMPPCIIKDSFLSYEYDLSLLYKKQQIHHVSSNWLFMNDNFVIIYVHYVSKHYFFQVYYVYLTSFKRFYYR